MVKHSILVQLMEDIRGYYRSLFLDKYCHEAEEPYMGYKYRSHQYVCKDED